MGSHRDRHDWSDLAAATAASSLLRPGLLLEPWRFQGNVRKFWNPTWFLSPKEKVVECRHASTEGALDASVPVREQVQTREMAGPCPHSSVIAKSVHVCVCVCARVCVCVLSCFSHVWLFATPWTIAHQSPLSMGFSRQEYWGGLPSPLPGIFPTQGSNPRLLCFPHCRQILYHWATWKS